MPLETALSDRVGSGAVEPGPLDLDDAYNNQATVPNMREIRADWATRSSRIRNEHGKLLDLRFGDGYRERLDLFLSAEANAPTVTYIHGGYWQANDKENYAFVAEGPLSAGFNVAVIEYTLAPEASVDQMVAEMGRAAGWLHENLGRYGADPDQIYMAGHSSGGHLTASNIHHPALRGGVSISGLFDLDPMRFTHFNDKLRLTEQTARALSPYYNVPATAAPLLVAFGGGELAEFHRQSKELVEKWSAAGLKCKLLEVPGANHFTAVEALASPSGLILEELKKMVRVNA
jgi:arylformamidase